MFFWIKEHSFPLLNSHVSALAARVLYNLHDKWPCLNSMQSTAGHQGKLSAGRDSLIIVNWRSGGGLSWSSSPLKDRNTDLSDLLANPVSAYLRGKKTSSEKNHVGRYGTKTGGECKQIPQNVCSMQIADPISVAKCMWNWEKGQAEFVTGLDPRS